MEPNNLSGASQNSVGPVTGCRGFSCLIRDSFGFSGPVRICHTSGCLLGLHASEMLPPPSLDYNRLLDISVSTLSACLGSPSSMRQSVITDSLPLRR